MLIVVGGCGEPEVSPPMTKSTSVPDLMEMLPNLRTYDIRACSYSVDKRSEVSWVPSPSDVRVELKGSATLSENAARALKAAFDWKPAKRDDIPASLAGLLPAGGILVSHQLNESFEGNRTYPRGFVATMSADDWRKIYFLARDIDHPIK
jgi:hypothetical protein